MSDPDRAPPDRAPERAPSLAAEAKLDFAKAAGAHENTGREDQVEESPHTLTTHAKLVYMANQIAKFFAVRPEPEAVAGTSDHLRKFWDPRMRRLIIEHFDSGGEGLDAITRKAIEQLKTRS